MNTRPLLTARREWKCADCAKPILPGSVYCRLYEYGEVHQLHVSCAVRRNQHSAGALEQADGAR